MNDSIRIEAVKEIDNSYSVVIHIRNFFTGKEIDKIKNYLDQIDIWEGGDTWGNPIRRTQNWYHVDGKKFGTNWKNNFPRWTSKEYPEWLSVLQNKIQLELNELLEKHEVYTKYKIDPVSINSVLVNKYRDGKDSFRAHKDDEEIFGNNPTIISVSFGRTRPFLMTRSYHDPQCPKRCKINQDEENLNLDFQMKSGDILIMAGSSQKYFCHEVPKCVDGKSQEQELVRYNMTFRNHKN